MNKELPNGWIETELKNLGEYINGRAFKPSEWKLNGLPIIRIQNLNDQTADFNYSDVEHEEKYLVRKGELLMAWSASLGVYFWEKDDAWLNQHIFKVLPNTCIVTKGFMYYSLQESISAFYAKTHGSGMVHITKPVFEAHKIPLPPLPTQQRIVAKLDSLFARIDQMKTNWSNFLDKVDAFVESSLIDKRTGEYFLRKELKEYLEEGTERIGKDWPGKLKIGISAQKGIIDLDVGQKQTFENYKIVRPGDFVYNAMRVNIGSIGIYEGSEIAITSPDYIVFRITNLLSPKLLLRFLKSKGGLLEIGANTQGSVRSRLYFKYLINVNYPIAPLKKQIEAEKFLSIFDTAINEWNRNISIQLDNLKQSILAKAFRGELVEQLLEDGDARELLEALRQAQRPGKGEMKRSGTGKKENVKPKSEKILRRAQDDTVLKQVAEPEEKYLGKE